MPDNLAAIIFIAVLLLVVYVTAYNLGLKEGILRAYGLAKYEHASLPDQEV